MKRGRQKLALLGIGVISAVLVGSVWFFLAPYFSDASPSDNVSGWAWSETIGWISFNSTNQGSGAGYGITVDGTGAISGYAWSEHAGWISFNDTAGCPSSPCQPVLNSSTGEISGWAKALAADGNGWDGWIHLRGSNYGVFATGCSWDGYAWGSDVVGWIHFRGPTYGVAGSGNGCFTPFDYTLTNTGDVQAAPGFSKTILIEVFLTGGVGQPVTLSLSVLPSGASASFGTNPCQPTCSSALSISTSAATPIGTYPLTVTGAPLGKTTSFDLVVAPTIDNFTANPPSINPGGSSTLSWSTNGFDSASIDQGIGSVPTSGSVDVSPTETTTYTFTGNPGSVSATVTVNVTKSPKFQEVIPQ